MSDLNSALESAFETERVTSVTTEAAPKGAPEPEPAASEADKTSTAESEGEANEPQTPTVEPLTPQEVAELKRSNPKLAETYRRMMKPHTELQQKAAALEKQIAERAQFFDALNNPATQRQAVEALARSVGIQIQPTDEPQRQQAAAVADGISEEWSKVVGPEAAQLLRPLIEKTALAAVNGTLQPIQKATEYLQMDARSRQAEAQVSQFKAVAQKQGWNLTPQVEARMAELGQQILPARPIESVDDGVKHLERLYRLATADTAEQDIEKRILERMNKAAQSAEPTRAVPSTGREKRTNITKDMDLSQALDVAFAEEGGR